jgi:anti-sigma factor RsiW
MSLSRETMLELMAFADGELDGEARARAERLVAGNVEARRTVDEFRASRLGPGLRDVMASRADAAGADDIGAAVMARLGVKAQPPPPVSLATRLHGPRARARRAATVVAGAFALAAAVALYMRATRGSGTGGTLGEARVGATSVEWTAPPPADSASGAAAGAAPSAGPDGGAVDAAATRLHGTGAP